MKKTLVLKAEIREHAGSTFTRKVRMQSRIPAVVYGHGQEPVSISLDEHDFIEGLHHGHRLMDIKMAKKTEKVIVKDLQYDYLGKKIIHVDLIRVDVSERVKVSIPIELKGKAKGITEGGIIEEHTNSLEVECVVTDIPETIVISVKEIDVGDSLHASDVELPAGTKLITDLETVLVTCSLVAAAKGIAEPTEEVEEAEIAEPEIIGQKKPEEETQDTKQG